MNPIVQCIPNFSEGKRPQVIQALARAIKAIDGVHLIDYSSDASHNRSVFTFIGGPSQVKAAAFAACQVATDLIDMTKHQGGHPRMGATDVIPFVPIKDISEGECISLSKELGAQIAQELSIPVFLYEASATSPERKSLANLRRGQFEKMGEKLKDPQWAPDFGKPQIHPTAGVVAVGARLPLIAYNINLGTRDISIADKIARLIRERNGGLVNVRAIGVMLEGENIAQVSINMVNYQQTALYRAFEMVKMEARRYGVEVIGSEIIGLTPMQALVDVAAYYLRLEGFDPKTQVLENHLL